MKRPGKNSKISYKYGFDADDRLIVSISVSEWGECCEYLICEENRVYGIEFSIDGEVSSVSEEVFENTRIKSYAVAYADGRESFFEVHGECFSYDENGCLDESEMLNICYMIFKRSRPEIVTHWIYKFISDDDGFLKKYKMIYDSSPGFQEDDLWFDIKEKRQIN